MRYQYIQAVYFYYYVFIEHWTIKVILFELDTTTLSFLFLSHIFLSGSIRGNLFKYVSTFFVDYYFNGTLFR